MRQSTKLQWKTQWNGHSIVVENWRDAVGRTGVRVFVDGAVVAEAKSEWLYTVGFCQSRVELDGKFEDESGAHHIKVKFGLNRDLICHVLVNGELVGGNTEKALALTEAEAAILPVAGQKKRLKRQLLWFSVVLPVIVFLSYQLMDRFFFSTHDLSSLMFPVVMCVGNTLKTLSKLFKLPRENSDKNSTSL